MACITCFEWRTVDPSCILTVLARVVLCGEPRKRGISSRNFLIYQCAALPQKMYCLVRPAVPWVSSEFGAMLKVLQNTAVVCGKQVVQENSPVRTNLIEIAYLSQPQFSSSTFSKVVNHTEGGTSQSMFPAGFLRYGGWLYVKSHFTLAKNRPTRESMRVPVCSC